MSATSENSFIREGAGYDLLRRLPKYLAISFNQISLKSWRAFLGVEVLYGKGGRHLTLEEFFHCFRPLDISKSKGIYSFIPRKLLLRLICKTPDSNRDWKNRYFFLRGTRWICPPTEEVPQFETT